MVEYVATPLREAARAGQTEFAIELMTLMPSFTKKLNPQGLSALHLAVMAEADEPEERRDNEKRNCDGTDKARRRAGPSKRESKDDSLHYAVRENNLPLLAEFLCACPNSIHDLTNKYQSAVHIAVQERKSDALDVLPGWLTRRNEERVFRFKDNHGNNALHVAVEMEQIEVVKKLVAKVNRNSLNSNKLTPFDIAVRKGNRDIKEYLKGRGVRSARSLPKKETLHDFLKSKELRFEKPVRYLVYLDEQMSLDMCNVIFVVAVLIITAAFREYSSLQVKLGKGVKNESTTLEIRSR